MSLEKLELFTNVDPEQGQLWQSEVCKYKKYIFATDGHMAVFRERKLKDKPSERDVTHRVDEVFKNMLKAKFKPLTKLKKSGFRDTDWRFGLGVRSFSFVNSGTTSWVDVMFIKKMFELGGAIEVYVPKNKDNRFIKVVVGKYKAFIMQRTNPTSNDVPLPIDLREFVKK